MTQIQQDIDFVKSILPSHYTVKESKPEGRCIHCVSSIGIEESPYQLWQNIFDQFKGYFKDRFQEVFHNVCANHRNFSIYIKKPTWTKKFAEEFEREASVWEQHSYLNNWNNQQKQQHMTPLSINDPQLVSKLSDILEVLPVGRTKEATEQNIKNVLLPLLEQQGLCFCLNVPSNGYSEPKMGKETLTAALAPGQSTGEFHETLMKQREMGKGLGDYSKPISKTPVAPPQPVFGIGTAMDVAQAGKKIARKGWNGKDMFVYYVPAGCYPSLTDVAKKEFGSTVVYNHYLAIKNVDGTVSTWAPSCSDALAKDWYIVE